MRKDIDIPKVVDVGMAIALEGGMPDPEWAVYLINMKDRALRNVIVSSKGYGELDGEPVRTSALTHFFERVAPGEAVRVERIMEDVFALSNEYMLTFYIDSLIHDRKFVFVPGSIEEQNLVDLPIVGMRGILIR